MQHRFLPLAHQKGDDGHQHKSERTNHHERRPWVPTTTVRHSALPSPPPPLACANERARQTNRESVRGVRAVGGGKGKSTHNANHPLHPAPTRPPHPQKITKSPNSRTKNQRGVPLESCVRDRGHRERRPERGGTAISGIVPPLRPSSSPGRRLWCVATRHKGVPRKSKRSAEDDPLPLVVGSCAHGPA